MIDVAKFEGDRKNIYFFMNLYYKNVKKKA